MYMNIYKEYIRISQDDVIIYSDTLWTTTPKTEIYKLIVIYPHINKAKETMRPHLS